MSIYSNIEEIKSIVVSRKTSASSKGYANAGQTSQAWIKTGWGEKAAFYYNY